MTKKYITPCTFQQIFINSSSPFRIFLTSHPQLLAIVTTRGLPAAISDTITPEAGPCGEGYESHFCQPAHGLYASFEAALSRLGLGSLGQGDLETAYDYVNNPYYPLPPLPAQMPYASPDLEDFSDFLDAHCQAQSNPVCLGQMFIASRLDSHSIDAPDPSGNGGNVDSVLAMIDRSQHLEINQYAVSALFDTSPESFATNNPTADLDPNMYLGTAISMWNDFWCYIYEDSPEFANGPTDPHFEPSTDGPLMTYPLVAVQTWGRHHQNSVMQDGTTHQYSSNYIFFYPAHPAGVFLSLESFNGWALHAGDDSYQFLQGQVTEWIAAGGSFTVGYIQEPTTGSVSEPRVLFKNFFVRGMTWGESVMGSLPWLGAFSTPIGDPLAKVIVYNPDLTGDRIVDEFDLDIVLNHMGDQNGVLGDINHDGIVDMADVFLVRSAYGRNATSAPTRPLAGIGCGDFNHDNHINQADLDDWDVATGNPQSDIPCPLTDCYPCPCVGDFDSDAVIGPRDRAVIEGNQGVYLFDIDGNGCFNDDDVIAFDAYYFSLNGGQGSPCIGAPNYDPQYDVNCDGCVGRGDWNAIHTHTADPPCPPP